ncbi:hypothetical protein B488_06710 [Liberibacter crescens BT-1]|uniref:Uncharacterized protein n=1 Tax=Liberibacter crescens (strain BT-1) TaxID=1215343 RepID=L0EVH4_LIBCB|nr:hypothetical protein [Liberibacter crescens]AGA64663.1 hypothetical protein B488_06710 [Liberibacter crescens BT-1]AMC12767.1 hypothetical protein RL73_03450 [Liberibacter crescens]
MKVLFQGQVPKDTEYPEANEDAVAISDRGNRIAISDGASESFDSQTWARLIACQFVENSTLDEFWLTTIMQKYKSNFDLSSLSWSKQEAFERGSFATLLGVEEDADRRAVDIVTVGDSLAILLDDVDFVESFPYKNSEEFRQKPLLFCTHLSDNTFFLHPNFSLEHRKTWNLEKYVCPLLMCMTDALGEWALRHAAQGNSQWHFLREMSDPALFRDVVLTERANKRMRVDDVTLLIISFDMVKGHEISLL